MYLPICVSTLLLTACKADEEKLIGMWDIKESHMTCDKPNEFVDDSTSTETGPAQIKKLEQLNLEMNRQIDFLPEHKFVLRDRLIGAITGSYKIRYDSLILDLNNGERLNAARFEMTASDEFQLWQSYPYADPANKCVIRQVFKKLED